MARQKVNLGEMEAARPKVGAPVSSPPVSPDAPADDPQAEAADAATEKPKTRRQQLAALRKQHNPVRRKARNKGEQPDAERKRRKRRANKARKNGEPVPEDAQDPPRGRPPFVLTEEMQAQVQVAAAMGITIDGLATILGISPATIFEHKAQFQEALDRGSLIAVGRVNKSLFENAVSGSLGHALAWHKIVRGWRESNGLELSGPGGGPVESVSATATRLLTDEEINRRLLTLVERSRGVMAQPSDVALEDDVPIQQQVVAPLGGGEADAGDGGE